MFSTDKYNLGGRQYRGHPGTHARVPKEAGMAVPKHSTARLVGSKGVIMCIAALSILVIACGAAYEMAMPEMQLPGTAWAASHDSGSTVTADGIFFERTALIEFTNNSGVPVTSFTMWLASGQSFESFKTEEGWIGKRTAEGYILLTAGGNPGAEETVKFGVKTSESGAGINWRAEDAAGNTIKIGRTVPQVLAPEPEPEPEPEPDEPPPEPASEGILPGSAFRIIPERPNVGSTIRVVGEGFEASKQLSFYMDSMRLGTFLSGNGGFVTTMKIPDDINADRVNFRVIDANGDEKTLSLRLGDVVSRVPETDDIRLTMNSVPAVLYRGDTFPVSGTAQPNSAVTASVKNAEGTIISSKTAEVNARGDWTLSEPVMIPLDAVLGKYSIEVSDGREDILRSWEVESSKVIIIESTKIRYDAGEVIKFDGTALPNTPVEFILEDPKGAEVSSNIVDTDGTGAISFEYETSMNSMEGTYSLIAKQRDHVEFVFVGLGQLPDVPVNLELDRLNYKAFETATIYITGEASEVLSLLIIDPSDKPKGDAIPITLKPDGTAQHSLELTGFKSGVYTAVISKGSSKSVKTFTVGLEMGAGKITLNTTQTEYKPGDPMLILGTTEVPNTLLRIILTDPDGKEIKVKDTFSNKNGKISEDSFRVPSSAKHGTWTVTAKSGANFVDIKINVAPTTEGIKIQVSESERVPTGEKLLKISITDAGPSRSIKIEIISPDGEIIPLKGSTKNDGSHEQPWKIPENIEPGIYTFKVIDARDSAETTHEIT